MQKPNNGNVGPFANHRPRLAWMLTCMLLCLNLSMVDAQTTGNVKSDDNRAQQQSNLVVQAYVASQQGQFERSMALCDSALQAGFVNPDFYFIKSLNYQLTNRIGEAVDAAQRALQTDDKYILGYRQIIGCLYAQQRYGEVEHYCQAMLSLEPGNELANDYLASVAAEAKNKTFSTVFLLTLLALILLLSGLLFFKFNIKLEEFEISRLFVLAVFCTAMVYAGFFYFAQWIRSLNVQIPADRITPWIRPYYLTEHDGIEGFVLYAICFLIPAMVLVLSRYFPSVSKRLLLILLSGGGLFFFARVGFFPPMATLTSSVSHVLFLLSGVAVIILGLLYLQEKYVGLLYTALGILLIPICFIATSKISMTDYAYIFAPALRLKQGNAFHDIYFQYDIFLSLLAWLWMKMNMALDYFPLLGQLSFFLLFIGLFHFARRFYLNRSLAVFFIVALVLTRSYALMHDSVNVFQVTPLRLDLWLILLLLAYWKGWAHWSLGAVLGLLVIFHKNFGLIYLAAYMQWTLVVFLMTVSGSKNRQTLFPNHVWRQARSFLSSLKYNIILIFVGFLVGYLFFAGANPESAANYQKIGIGMLPITSHSFGWYLPILFTLVAFLLIKQRDQLTERYWQTGLFIVCLAIGNSIYFFGRSHEHNLLNISAILIVLLFLGTDLVDRHLSRTSFLKNTIPSARSAKLKIIRSLIPLCIVLLIVFSYAEGIRSKWLIQIHNLEQGQLLYRIDPDVDLESVYKLVGGQRKVYFLKHADDFIYSYMGGYRLEGYYQPLMTWIFQDQLTEFLQNLLEQGYYIIADNSSIPTGANCSDPFYIFNDLKFSHCQSEKKLCCIWN